MNLCLKMWLAFSATYFIWGSTYLANRIALESFGPFLMMGIRSHIDCGRHYCRFDLSRNASPPKGLDNKNSRWWDQSREVA